MNSRNIFTTAIIVAYFFSATNAQVNLDSGLVAHYPFNGNANDESGNNYHGTVNGSVLSPDRFGNPNTAYNFDGSNDYILVDSIPPVNFGTGDFTLSTWCKAGLSQLTYPQILSTRSGASDGFIHGLFSDGQFFFQTGSSATVFSSSGDIRDNQWHHLITVRNTGIVTVYLDGVQVGSGNVSTNISSPNSLYMGWDIGNPSVTYFNGLIDDIRIYNRALNSAEIQALNNTAPPSAPVAGFTVNDSTVTAGAAVQFTDLSTNNPTSWNWSFPGGTPSSSTSQNPLITYNTYGIYDVTLIVSNANGSDTLVKSNHIAVSPAWEVFNTSNSGISDDNIWDIEVDAQGNKWLATGYYNGGSYYGGISKFDGATNWTIYNSGNSGLKNNYVYTEAFDKLGNIWFGHDGFTGAGGISKFNGSSWNTYLNGISNVYAVVVDDSLSKWIGTYSGGLYKLDSAGNLTQFNTSNSSIPTNFVLCVIIDNAGAKWIATYGGGVAKFDGTTWTIYNTSNSGLPSDNCNNLNALDFDQNGHLWISTMGGLAEFDGSNWNVFTTSNSGLPSNTVTCIRVAPDGVKWIGTDMGLASLDSINWTVYNTSNSSIPSNEVYSLAFEPGIVWVGTYGGGLAKLMYQYIPAVAPVADFIADDTTVTAGTAVTFTDNSSGAPTAWNWSFPGGTPSSSTAQNPSAAYNTTGIYDVTLIVSNAAGSDTLTKINYITVSSPIIYINAGFSSSTVCKGDSTQFTDLSSGNDTVTSWNWNFGDTASGSANSSTLQNPKHLFTNSGVYNVTLIASGSSVSDTITKQVVVNTLPQANGGTDKTICAGSGVYLYATGGNAYSWSPATGLNCTTCQQPYASPSDTTSYIVTVTNSNQCTAKDTVVVNVAPIPSPSIIPPGDTICQGNTTILDAGSGYTDYSWNTGETTQSITVAQAGWYYVWVTNSAGCWGQSQYVYVGIKSNVTVTVAPSATVCEGEIITLSASGGFIMYQWSDGSTGQNINVTLTGTYTVTATDGINCSMVSSPVNLTVKDTNITPQIFVYGDTSFCDGGYVWLEAPAGFNTYQWSNSITTQWNYITSSGVFTVTVTDICGSYSSLPISVTEYPKPNPTLTQSGSTTLCQGQNVTLTAPNGYTYYYWQQTGTSLPSILVTSAGDYFCWVQDANDCWGTSDTVTVTVGPDISISPTGYSTICDGSSLTITANGTNIISYLWSSGETTQSINATTAGNYNITVTDNNSCTGSAPYSLILAVLDTNPVPVINMLYNDSVLCQGESVYLYTTCNYIQYQWSNGANGCGQYVYQGGNNTVTVNNGCGTGTSAPVSITVNTLPLVSAGSDVSICGGQSATLNASGGVLYQWYPSYGLSCTNCQSPSASPAYTTTYTVYGTDAAGCQGWDNVTVSVEPSSVSFSAYPTVQYLPDDPGTTYFTYTGSTANITNYLWDFGDGNQSTAVNPVHTYITKGWYDIALTVTNNTGCSTTITYTDYILIEQIFPATTLNTGTNNTINSVSFISGYYGCAAMSDGNILITNDGGGTWTTGYVNAGVPLWGIYLIGNAGYVVGDNGFISVSYDGGVSWSNFVTGVSYALYNVYLSSLNYGFAVGVNGTILQYNGTNWASVNLGITVDLNAVYTYGLFTYIVGNSGLILKYDGFSWDTLVSNVTVDLSSIYFGNNLTGYAAGADGTIIMTSDGGVTWTTVFSGIISSFTTIASITADSVIAVGSDGIVYMSVDAGLNWGRYSIGDNRTLYGVSAVNDGWGGVTGYIAGVAGGVFKFEKTIITPVEEKSLEGGSNLAVRIYPNPANDNITISISKYKMQNVTCKIFDMMGREVKNVIMNNQSITIGCAELQPGIYFIKVISEEVVSVSRLVIAD
ncbi:MAG: PKD domain-containing protein [Bacteroidetes bacterium]|nr:PKD domain-containing protein [Bacteroidota bacterium]